MQVEDTITFNHVITCNNFVIVFFNGEWCKSCLEFMPRYRQLYHLYPAINFLKVNVEEAPDLSDKCGIKSVPAFDFYVDGYRHFPTMFGIDEKIMGEYISEMLRLFFEAA